MKNTETLLDAKARRAVLAGVNAIYEPVKRTLGPKGKSALLYRTYNRGSRITDDGVTVAEVQEPKNPFVKLAADTFKEMCKRTVEKVGDGTTSTAVIGGKLMNDAYNFLTENTSEFNFSSTRFSSVDIAGHILKSASLVKEEITKRSKKILALEDLEYVAIISVKDKELGKIIAKMAWEVGVDGHIDVVEGYKGTIETELSKGMRFASKVAAKAFLNNPKRFEMVVEDSPVLITNYAMDNGGDVAPLLQRLNEKTSKLTLVAPSFSDSVLVGLINASKQGFFINPVAAPALRTEQFEDLAIYCGAEFINKAKGFRLQNVQFGQLGFFEKMIVKDTDAREEAVVTGGRGSLPMTRLGEAKTFDAMVEGGGTTVSSPVTDRIATLKEQEKEQKQNNFKLLFQRRIASMASAVGVIRVGESTQASSLYTKLKIEDGVYACKAALRGGYSKGGGLELKEIAEDILSEDDLLRPALMHPYELIQASVPGGIKITADIIDPTEALYYAVEHATSVVAKLITVEVITPEIEDTNPGDGYLAIARAMGELSISLKLHFGQLKESEIEAERDRMQGLTVDEKIMLDNG